MRDAGGPRMPITKIFSVIRFVTLAEKTMTPQTQATCSCAGGEVKTSSIAAFVLATVLSGSPAAYAQAEQPTITSPSTPGPSHRSPPFRGAQPGPSPERAAATTAAPQTAPFGLALPHIAPYPDGKGDEDGMSEDQDDATRVASTATRRIDGQAGAPSWRACLLARSGCGCRPSGRSFASGPYLR